MTGYPVFRQDSGFHFSLLRIGTPGASRAATQGRGRVEHPVHARAHTMSRHRACPNPDFTPSHQGKGPYTIPGCKSSMKGATLIWLSQERLVHKIAVAHGRGFKTCDQLVYLHDLLLVKHFSNEGRYSNRIRVIAFQTLFP